MRVGRAYCLESKKLCDFQAGPRFRMVKKVKLRQQFQQYCVGHERRTLGDDFAESCVGWEAFSENIDKQSKNQNALACFVAKSTNVIMCTLWFSTVVFHCGGVLWWLVWLSEVAQGIPNVNVAGVEMGGREALTVGWEALQDVMRSMGIQSREHLAEWIHNQGLPMPRWALSSVGECRSGSTTSR